MEFGIGKRIKEARLNKGLTQEMLALMVGVTKGAIANYENGTSHPKEPVMYALIDALGVDANFLFQDCVKIKKAPLYSSEAMRLARDYDSLDSHGQRIVRLVANEEKARCTAEAGATARTPAKLPQEMTDEEFHAELDRQLTGEKKQAESGSASGRGSSGTVAG